MADEDAEKEAARRHAENKRVIKSVVEALLEATALPRNAEWLAWYRALRRCVDGKKDDLADTVCQAYYYLRDKLKTAAAARAKVEAKLAKATGIAASAKVGTKRKREADEAVEASTDALSGLGPAVDEATASSVDLGFRNLAFAVVRVFADASVSAHPLLAGYNIEVLRWQRVDCATLAGVADVNINATNMHRLTEILMCGVAKYADALFGTTPADLALPRGRLDYFLLENQKGGGGGFGPMGKSFGSNVKTYAASHILQACCMLHYAVKGLPPCADGKPRCPAIEFVGSSLKTQDAELVAALPVPLTGPLTAPVTGLGAAAAAVGADGGKHKAKRAKKGEAAAMKEALDEAWAGAEAGAGAGAGVGAGAGAIAVMHAEEERIWRAPFAVGTEGIVWKAGKNPDLKKRAAEAARAAKKRAAKSAAVFADDF